MKPITIRNQQYYYLSNNYSVTWFYLNPEEKECIFSVFKNIENPYFTKEEIRKELEEKVEKYLQIQERKLEIERGEII